MIRQRRLSRRQTCGWLDERWTKKSGGKGCDLDVPEEILKMNEVMPNVVLNKEDINSQ